MRFQGHVKIFPETTGSSRHLKVLAEAGLVSTTKHGQARLRKLEVAALKEATDWIEKYRSIWAERSDRFNALRGELLTQKKRTE